jgi:hypothetical protein
MTESTTSVNPISNSTTSSPKKLPSHPALPPAWPPQAGTNLFTARMGPYVYYRIPAVGTHFADRGIVILFAEARNTQPTSPDPDQGFIDIVMRRSNDGLGARWGPQALVHSESNAFDSQCDDREPGPGGGLLLASQGRAHLLPRQHRDAGDGLDRYILRPDVFHTARTACGQASYRYI